MTRTTLAQYARVDIARINGDSALTIAELHRIARVIGVRVATLIRGVHYTHGAHAFIGEIVVSGDDADYARIIGANIRDARAQRRMTRATFGDAVALSAHAVERIERGATIITGARVRMIATAIDADVRALLHGAR